MAVVTVLVIVIMLNSNGIIVYSINRNNSVCGVDIEERFLGVVFRRKVFLWWFSSEN